MNIVVTGASRGIGYELVRFLSSDESNTVFAVSRHLKGLEELKGICLKANPASRMIPIHADISEPLSAKEISSKLSEHITRVDVLINNAGTIVNKPFLDLSTQDLEIVYNVNVFSVVRLIQALLPFLEHSEKAHIVNIGSMGGFQGSSKFAGLSAYSSSKAALACLSECLAEELKDRNIAVNCLALGAAQTEMLSEAFPGYKAPLSGQEMACHIGYFAMNAHKYMNGKVIPFS
ncbi:MAG: SDR family oxidoreductase, partial [Bacteroidota bacterium]|nr:SDR family oxidoreductase [Bacteroidota bacterium]